MIKTIQQIINNPIIRMSQIIYWLLKRTSITTKWYGNPILLIIYIIGWYLGLSLHNWFNYTQFGWILELIIATTLISYKNMFIHVTNTLNQLYSTDLDLCRYKLLSIVNKTTKHLDEYGICNYTLLLLIENFNNSILLPLFYYLFTGLPGLILYKTSDLTNLMLSYIKTSNNTLSLNVWKANNIMASCPCFTLIFISNLIRSIGNNNFNVFGLLNLQRWSVHLLILKFISWLNIKIKPNNTYNKLYIIHKNLNNSGYLPNVIDVIKLKTQLCITMTILMVTTIIIKGTYLRYLDQKWYKFN
ncbi:cobalamin biosynthesis protein [Candidatus Hodgkinia cicadicola]|uniref:Cobalamin biosynthesis protein n=1 Tax=Candidatus Hodgkinia cicadicola TaxID=573658 RepID=A0ABX4MJ40_9HYPH|nr:cobalamin biosynthesis protein [Candidatus Hodgkinia cicadicola]PIM95611.1 cobalamin biosynthesis protein [Candidatus Hodgkinia cicadicola]